MQSFLWPSKYAIMLFRPSPYSTPLGDFGASILPPSTVATGCLRRLGLRGIVPSPPKFFPLERRLVVSSCDFATNSVAVHCLHFPFVAFSIVPPQANHSDSLVLFSTAVAFCPVALVPMKFAVKGCFLAI